MATAANGAELLRLSSETGATQKGRVKMQTAANTSRFLTVVFSFGKVADSQRGVSKPEFYQQFALEIIKASHKLEVLSGLGDRLVALAEQFHAARQMGALEQVSHALTKLPLPRDYKVIGQYYEALRLQRFGCGDVEQARRLLERVAGEAPLFYRVRAMQSLAANSRHKGDYRTAISLYYEADRIGARNRIYDPYIIVGTPKMAAVISSLEGNHKGALAALEELFPIAHSMRRVRPQVYYDYLNSLAVELAVAGRLEEARSASRIALASPFASAYPEWRETSNDIALRGRRPSRSVVAFSRTTLETENVLRLPAPERSYSFSSAKSCLNSPRRSARILNYAEWKKKMVKEPNGPPNDDKPQKKLDDREKLLRIIQLVSQPERTDEELESILEAVEQIVSKSEEKDSQ